MKYLGIDYGTKRVGIAVSDETLTLAFPHSTVQNSKTLLDDVLALIEKEDITRVVLGESKNNDMKDNPVMVQVRAFKRQLEEKGVEVVFHPELYSSAQVVSVMGQQNKAIDASAAAIILQNYLDTVKR